MAPQSETPLDAEAVARAVTDLPAALFIGDVSGPLNAEASTLVEELDPKLEEIKVRRTKTLHRCLVMHRAHYYAVYCSIQQYSPRGG